MSKILLTAALPYANGSIHLGHMVEHVQADIFARFHRSIGTEIAFVCADDTHGTAIELRAERENLTPEQLIDGVWHEHTRDFADFGITFDHYHTTHSPENKRFAETIYAALRDGDHLVRRVVTQMYSESLGRFLNDRMVKGTCPNCGAKDQYGDVCEVCNKTYEPTDLIEPYDVVSGTAPVLRETENIYVRLSDFDAMLRQWMKTGIAQDPVRKFVDGWLESGLEDWCISRDAPYFGFAIPDEPGKFFYVWLDAPIGYIAATESWANQRGLDWRDWWAADADTRIIHIVGKDIVYFHTLFWPAMLHAAGLKTPERVQVHGFLTVNREKMSKSRGTFVNARTYLDHLDPDYLRFYYAAKLHSGIDDLDLSLEDFVTRVNADLVNNLVNLASRVTKFIEKRFDGEVASFSPSNYPIVATIAAKLGEARDAYATWEYRDAIRRIVETGDAVNEFFQAAQPWSLIREDEAEARRVCAVALHGATATLAALAPVTPHLAGRYAAALGVEKLSWEHADAGWRPERVTAPETLLDRVDAEHVNAMIEASRVTVQPDYALDVAEFEPTISFDDFAKIDLRVGVIEEARTVEGADKLLQLTVHCGKRINVFAGIRSAYPEPAQLVGKRALVVANLAPRKMRFGTSEGMLLAMSGPDDEGLQLVHPDASALGGWRVR
jgi:methionyl-tRNA synthetase